LNRSGRADYLAHEWHHVVFTHAEDVDVSDEDQIVVVDLEYGVVDHFIDIVRIPLGEEEKGFGVSIGGLDESLPVRIFSNVLQHFLRCICQFLLAL
jgi:hypothetical protein